MKRFLATIYTIFFLLCSCEAGEFLQGNLTEDILFNGVPVRITPVKKITTSKSSLKVGTPVYFVTSRDVLSEDAIVIKRNTSVKGKVLNIKPNRSVSIPAKITIGEFETTDVFGEIVPLKGEIIKEGNSHNTLISYIDFLAIFVRGGEVQIVPDEDYFIIFY